MSKGRIIKGLLFGFLCSSVNLIEGQVLGGQFELTRNVSTLTAEARLLFRSPVPAIAYLKVNWGDGSAEDSLPFNGDVFDNANEFAIKYFSGTHTYSQNAVCTITAGGINFSSAFQNIPNAQMQKLVMRGMINLQVYANSPVSVFKTYVYDTVPCTGDPSGYTANMGMQNPDHDSLAYSINPHPEISGYVIPPIGVSPVTGMMTFTANASGNYNVGLRTDAWRKNAAGVYDMIIGTSYIELYVSACNVQVPPSTTSIESIEAKSVNLLNLFPNPTSNIVTVNTGVQGMKQVRLMDAMGRLLMNTEQTGEQFNINMSEFTNGVYFLFVRTELGALTSKILKE